MRTDGRRQDNGLTLQWMERSGPDISGATGGARLWHKLVRDMVAQRLIGAVDYAWAPQG